MLLTPIVVYPIISKASSFWYEFLKKICHLLSRLKLKTMRQSNELIYEIILKKGLGFISTREERVMHLVKEN
tara:strand:- start:257 stop:472 length:216 start_codon:yes stop_codon:yes gene_type:complete